MGEALPNKLPQHLSGTRMAGPDMAKIGAAGAAQASHCISRSACAGGCRPQATALMLRLLV